MIVSIHQPEYLPWLGFFNKLTYSDVFVILDDVQFEKGSFQNRNKIRTPNGWNWLTIPILHKFPEEIKDVKINGTDWKETHMKALWMNYKNAPYFNEYFFILKEAYSRDWESLADLNIYLIKRLAEILDIEISIIKSSSMSIEKNNKNEHLIDICKFLGADTYLCGQGGKTYINEELFNKNRIKILFYDYKHPIYHQRFYGFVPYMSVVDLLFNLGKEAKSIISSGGVLIENISDRGTSR